MKLKKRYLISGFFVFFALFVFLGNICAKEKEFDAKVSILANEKYVKSILKDIERAKYRIYMAMFMFKADGDRKNPSSMIERALIRAARHGVKVYVILEKSKDDRKSIASRSNKKTAKYLKRAGIIVKFDSETRMLHTKAIVIDNIVYIGSHNLTRSGLGRNCETSVKIKSKDVADEMVKLIKNIW
jgi:phosphatidylserine/phosphatidylglycerophosphate/cardiolipin synthase-like enzyme